MDIIPIEKLQYLQIGQQGENDARKIYIDMTSWVEQYPDTEIGCYVLFVPPGEKNPWPMTSEWNSGTNILTWNIKDSVTAVDGQGYMEVRALQNEVIEVDPDTDMVRYTGLVKKSKTIPTLIDSSISGIVGGSRSAPYQDFLNQVLTIQGQLNTIFREATTEYAISTSYSTPPETGWDDDMPNISQNKGKYLWTRITFNWGTGEPSIIHMVTYISTDTTGAITSVNGKTGAAVLDGGDINVDDDAQTTETIKAAITRIDGTTVPVNKGGTGQTTATAALTALMYSGGATSDSAPTSSDYIPTTASDGTVTRRPIDTVLGYYGASKIHSITEGYIVKVAEVTLYASSNYINYRFAADDVSKKLRVQRGMYHGTVESWNTNNIPLDVSLISGFDSGDSPLSSFVQGDGELSFSQPAFNYLNSTLQIRMPFTLAYTASTSATETFAASIKVRLAYLAAT